MTQEDKELLLKDLCARLPYGVKCHFKYGSAEGDITLSCIDINVARFEYGWYGRFHVNVDADYIKPYLFPISSMTEEQKYECFKGTPLEIDKYGSIAVKDNLYGGSHYTDLEIYLEVIVWLLKNHFDIYGLIPKGLEIDATGKNIY